MDGNTGVWFLIGVKTSQCFSMLHSVSVTTLKFWGSTHCFVLAFPGTEFFWSFPLRQQKILFLEHTGSPLNMKTTFGQHTDLETVMTPKQDSSPVQEILAWSGDMSSYVVLTLWSLNWPCQMHSGQNYEGGGADILCALGKGFWPNWFCSRQTSLKPKYLQEVAQSRGKFPDSQRKWYYSASSAKSKSTPVWICCPHLAGVPLFLFYTVVIPIFLWITK